MPFAEFQNGNAGLALPQFQAQSIAQTSETAGKMAERFSSLMERAQKMRINEQMLPLEVDQLQKANTLTQLRIARTEKENAVYSALNTDELVNKQADLKRDQIDADSAAAKTSLATQQYTYNMMKTMPQEVDRVLNAMGQLSSQSSGSNVPPMLRRPGTQPTGGLQNYEQYRQALNIARQFKARYGDFISASHNPALMDVLGRVNLFEANITKNYADSVATSMPDFMTKIGTAGKLATSEDPQAINQGMETLMNLQTDPSFHMAMSMNPGLKESWDKQFGVLENRQKTVNEQFNKQKESAANMAVKFTESPNVVQYQKAAGAVRNLRTIMDGFKDGKPNAYEDIAAITELFKILDPTLGLTAEQLAEFQKAGSTLDQWKIFATKFGYGGGRQLLTDDMRKKIMEAADKTLVGPRSNYRENQQSLRGAIEAIGPGGRQFSKDYQFPDFEKDIGAAQQEQKLTLSYNGVAINGVKKTIAGKDYLQAEDGKLYPIQQ